MEKKDQYLIFMLDKRRFAVTLSAVKRISLAVEIVPLPEGPDIVMGVVNVKGEILPVVDIRKRFGLPEKEIDIRDHFLITQTKMVCVCRVPWLFRILARVMSACRW